LKEIRTEVDIDSSPEKVWQVLTDFGHYRDWNPFIRDITGKLNEGSRLEIQISTSTKKTRKYRPVLTKIEPNHEMRWLGKAFLPGLLDGERILTLQRLENNQVRLIHREIFRGIGVSLAGSRIDFEIRRKFEEMNSALKKKIEHEKQ
jgi:hypothetical protein